MQPEKYGRRHGSIRPSSPPRLRHQCRARGASVLRQTPSRTRAIGTLHDVLPPPALGRHSGAWRRCNWTRPRECFLLGCTSHRSLATRARVLRRRTIPGPKKGPSVTPSDSITRKRAPSSRSNRLLVRWRRMRVTRWDANVLSRAAMVAMLALALAWLVTPAPDEGARAWGGRPRRTLPPPPL